MVSKTLAESVTAALKQHKQVLHYVSRAVFQAAQFQKWGVDSMVRDTEKIVVPKTVVIGRPQELVGVALG